MDETRIVQAMAQLARNDLAAFGSFVMGIPPAEHHKRWLAGAVDPSKKHLLIIAPPESAKTTWIASALVAWWIGNNPLSTNYIGSISDIQAHKRARVIAEMIENNPRYHAVFPWIKPDPDNWRAGDYYVWDTRYSVEEWRAQRLNSGVSKDATLFAAGAKSNAIIGARFTGLSILDDPQDEETTRTQLQRDRVWDWLTMVLMTRLTEKESPNLGLLRVIMTRWHSDDLAGRAMESGEWESMVTPAIDEETNTSYWPEMWPIEKLEAKRRSVGSARFRAAYLNDPRGLTGEVFKIEHIHRGYPDNFNAVELEKVVIGADLAVSQKELAAYTAIVCVGIDRGGRMIVLNMWREKYTFAEQVHAINRACAWAYDTYGRVDDCVVENNQFQQAVVQQALRAATWPIRGEKTDIDKVTRARGLSVLAEAGLLWLGHGPYVGALEGEMLEFPRGKYADQIDALSICHKITRAGRAMVIQKGNPFYRGL